MGRLSTPQPPCVSRRAAAAACDVLRGGDVARRHPRDPRRCVMAHRGACAGCRALRAPRVGSHIPGQTRLTTSVAVPRHRSLREAVPPAPMAAPTSRSTPKIGSFVQRVFDVQPSFSKGTCGGADVPQVPPLSCAGDRHVLLPQEESLLGAAELIVFEAVRARRLCDKNGVRLREGCLGNVSHHGRHRCQRHARPERLHPPGKPNHGGESSSRVTRVGSACAGRCLAGAHRKSPAHERVCHRDQRPRLSTTCREVLIERRTPARSLQDRRRVWRARLASTRRARERTADGARQARSRHIVPGQSCQEM
jgi:hypothetical protein